MAAFTTSVPFGSKTLVFEGGALAPQANGACLLRWGGTVILATVCAESAGSQDGRDFLPLTVEYRERYSAIGKIPGGFQRREIRMNDHEVLASRLIDRALRARFHTNFHAETGINVTVYGYESGADLEQLALLAASAALATSDLPFDGPVAVGRLSGEAELDGLIAFTREGCVMLEGGASELPESKLVQAVSDTMQEGAELLDALDDFKAQAAKTPLVPTHSKALSESQTALRAALSRGERADGRGLDQVRELSAAVRYLPTNDGSALFTRGQTQALVTVSLGNPEETIQLESITGKRSERFILHYTFPPFAVGEGRPYRGPTRREIGHGTLARRALLPMLPPEDVLPFAVRVTSDILSSNGSSSMATVCGASLALMDAGVPLRAHVAGVALGLTPGQERQILTDISGSEDASGDMDFKVAGTRTGLTAFQMDIKGAPLSLSQLDEALTRGQAARSLILDLMEQTLPEPREQTKRAVTIVQQTKIPPRRIGALIGPSGKTIAELQAQTNTRVEVKDDGRVRITGKTPNDVKAALARVVALTQELRLNECYEGTIVSLREFGIFVRIADHEGLVHQSELAATHPLKDLRAGQTLKVKVLGADTKGRLKLSHKAALS